MAESSRRTAVFPHPVQTDPSEFYMNCAKITVTGGGSGFNGPPVFVANLASVNPMKTVLGTDVIFPDPGPSVEYGGDGKTAPPVGGSGAANPVDAPPPPAQTSATSVVVGGPTTLQTVARPATKAPVPKVCKRKVPKKE